jgi:hypothetical protein
LTAIVMMTMTIVIVMMVTTMMKMGTMIIVMMVMMVMSPPDSDLQFARAGVHHVAVSSAELEMGRRLMDYVYLGQALLFTCEAGVDFGSQ